MRKIAALAVAVAVWTSPALAFQCPTYMQAIDAELGTADVSTAVRDDVRRLRQEGEDLHRAGRHAKSLAVLREALERLR